MRFGLWISSLLGILFGGTIVGLMSSFMLLKSHVTDKTTATTAATGEMCMAPAKSVGRDEKRVFLGVFCTEKDSKLRQAVRDTWGKELDPLFELKFVVASPHPLSRGDETDFMVVDMVENMNDGKSFK
jgi:hypothetical protein